MPGTTWVGRGKFRLGGRPPKRRAALRVQGPESAWFWRAARDLHVHDQSVLADSVGRRAVTWYRTELEKDPSVSLRMSLATAWFNLGEVTEARSPFEPIPAGDQARSTTQWAARLRTLAAPGLPQSARA
jgi:hypothetical protein